VEKRQQENQNTSTFKNRTDKDKGPHSRNTVLYSHLTSKADQTKTWITEEQATQGLTLRRLMSYIYGGPILDVSRSHTTTQHSR